MSDILNFWNDPEGVGIDHLLPDVVTDNAGIPWRLSMDVFRAIPDEPKSDIVWIRYTSHDQLVVDFGMGKEYWEDLKDFDECMKLLKFFEARTSKLREQQQLAAKNPVWVDK